MSNDGTYLFSGSNNGDVRAWDLKTKSDSGNLAGYHARWLTSMAISPDGTRLVSACRGNTMRIWDLTRGSLTKDKAQALPRHYGRINCVSCSPDGRFIVSGSMNKGVRVWNAITGEPVGEVLTGHSNHVLQVDVSGDNSVIHSSSLNQVICWKIETREQCSENLLVACERKDLYIYIFLLHIPL